MSYKLEDLEGFLDELEKVANESEEAPVTDPVSEATEEVKEAAEEQVSEAEKVAEDTVVAEEEKQEEKVASNETSSLSETVANLVEEKLVKEASDFGKIAAYSFFGELAALGIAVPTNNDMMVPPVSAISEPSQSPKIISEEKAIQHEKKASAFDQRAILENLKTRIYGE